MIKIMLLLSCFVFSKNVTVTIENSPFIVDSSVVLDTLDVHEGSTIFFNSGVEVTIKKAFFSKGTPTAGVKLASAENSPTPFDWPGILIDTTAEALILHTTFSSCIECINAKTTKIIVDSCYFKNIGQDALKVLGASVVSTSKDYFAYGAEKRFKKESKRFYKNPWMIGGIVGASIAIPVLFLATSKSKDNGTSTENKNTNDIKYPNLPDF